MRRAKVVVFPIGGRKWCFSRSILAEAIDSTSSSSSSVVPSTLKELWSRLKQPPPSQQQQHNAHQHIDKNNTKAQLLIDFVSTKMNNSWMALEKATPGSFKNKLHGFGLKLLARVKPSEIFLKSITRDVTHIDIMYPPSLNPRLVRRRLRHIAVRGAVIHRKYFYGSASLLPFTTAFTVLPLPNIPFFWVLFRTYSHWRALQGSEKLLQLVSDSSLTNESTVPDATETKTDNLDLQQKIHHPQSSPWVLQPRKELEELLHNIVDENGELSESAISRICKAYSLNANDVLKYKHFF